MATKRSAPFNPFTPKSDLVDFTLSNASRFYSSKGDPLGVKGLTSYLRTKFIVGNRNNRGNRKVHRKTTINNLQIQEVNFTQTSTKALASIH